MPVTPSPNARFFTQLFGTQHGAPSFGYLWDSTVVWYDVSSGLHTGAHRPATPADFAANISVSGLNLTVGAVAITGLAVVTTTGNTPVSVVNTAPLAFSGVVQANVTNPVLATSGVATILSVPTHNVTVTGGSIQTIVTGSVSASFDPTPIVNAQTTGNNYLANISGRLNNTLGAPINVSGVVSTSVTVGNVAVTGFPATIAPLAISGVVQATLQATSIAVTGFNSTIAPLAVSGTFAASINSVAITGNPGIAVTGFYTGITVAVSNAAEQSLLTTTNQLLSGVSGLLGANLTSAAWVTGAVSGTNLGSLNVANTYLPVSGVGAFTTNATIANTSPIPVSGVVQANVTNALLAVSGNSTLTNPLLAVSGIVQANITNTAPLATSGVVTILSIPTHNIAVTGGSITSAITGWNTGLVVITDVRSNSTAGNSTPSGASPFNGAGFFWGQALAANINRAELFVQNIHTGTPLYVNLGATAASTGAFSMILNPSTQLNWGGTSWGSRSWRGAVQVSGAAWIAWEL